MQKKLQHDRFFSKITFLMIPYTENISKMPNTETNTYSVSGMVRLVHIWVHISNRKELVGKIFKYITLSQVNTRWSGTGVEPDPV